MQISLPVPSQSQSELLEYMSSEKEPNVKCTRGSASGKQDQALHHHDIMVEYLGTKSSENHLPKGKPMDISIPSQRVVQAICNLKRKSKFELCNPN